MEVVADAWAVAGRRDTWMVMIATSHVPCAILLYVRTVSEQLITSTEGVDVETVHMARCMVLIMVTVVSQASQVSMANIRKIKSIRRISTCTMECMEVWV